jgi:hypothetical protein
MSIKNIEKMVRDIRAKRVSKVNNKAPVISPFIVVKQDENRTAMVDISEKTIRTKFVLGGIVNSTAFINGAWKKKGDMIDEFRLKTIKSDRVVLKRKNRTITLYFRKTKNIFKTDKE